MTRGKEAISAANRRARMAEEETAALRAQHEAERALWQQERQRHASELAQVKLDLRFQVRHLADQLVRETVRGEVEKEMAAERRSIREEAARIFWANAQSGEIRFLEGSWHRLLTELGVPHLLGTLINAEGNRTARRRTSKTALDFDAAIREIKRTPGGSALLEEKIGSTEEGYTADQVSAVTRSQGLS